MGRKTKAELEIELTELGKKYDKVAERNTELQTNLKNYMSGNDIVTKEMYDNMIKQFEEDIKILKTNNGLKDNEITRLKKKVTVLESMEKTPSDMIEINNKLDRLIEVICVDKVSNESNKVGRKKYNNIEVINRMKNLKDNGYGYLKIAKSLNSEGIMNSNDKPWSSSTIKYILDNYTEI